MFLLFKIDFVHFGSWTICAIRVCYCHLFIWHFREHFRFDEKLHSGKSTSLNMFNLRNEILIAFSIVVFRQFYETKYLLFSCTLMSIVLTQSLNCIHVFCIEWLYSFLSTQFDGKYLKFISLWIKYDFSIFVSSFFACISRFFFLFSRFWAKELKIDFNSVDFIPSKQNSIAFSMNFITTWKALLH